MTMGSADRGDRDPRSGESDAASRTSALWVDAEPDPETDAPRGVVTAPEEDAATARVASEPQVEAPATFPPAPPAAQLKTAPGGAENWGTGASASAEPAWSGAAEVHEPLFASEVPEPVFYVPPPEEEMLPATSVVELAPDALDAVLDAEFGPATAPQSGVPASAPTPPPPPTASSYPSFLTGATVAAPPPPAPPIPVGTPATAPVPTPTAVLASAPAPAPAPAPVAADSTSPAANAEGKPERTRGRSGSKRWWKRSASTLVSGRTARATNANIDADKVLDILLGSRTLSTNGSAPVEATLGPDAVIAPAVTPAPTAALVPTETRVMTPPPPPAPAVSAAPAPTEPAFVSPPPPPAAWAPAVPSAPTAPAVPPAATAPWSTASPLAYQPDAPETVVAEPVNLDPVMATPPSAPAAPPPPVPMPLPPAPVTPAPPPPAASVLPPPVTPELAPSPVPTTPEPVFTQDTSGLFRFDEPGAPAAAEPPAPPTTEPPSAYADPPTVSSDPVASSLSAIQWATAAPAPAPHGFEVPDTTGASPVEAEAIDEWNAPPDENQPVFSSAASMATEILSASPESPFVAEPEASGETDLISKDLTLIARSRRKRFRLR